VFSSSLGRFSDEFEQVALDYDGDGQTDAARFSAEFLADVNCYVDVQWFLLVDSERQAYSFDDWLHGIDGSLGSQGSTGKINLRIKEYTPLKFVMPLTVLQALNRSGKYELEVVVGGMRSSGPPEVRKRFPLSESLQETFAARSRGVVSTQPKPFDLDKNGVPDGYFVDVRFLEGDIEDFRVYAKANLKDIDVDSAFVGFLPGVSDLKNTPGARETSKTAGSDMTRLFFIPRADTQGTEIESVEVLVLKEERATSQEQKVVAGVLTTVTSSGPLPTSAKEVTRSMFAELKVSGIDKDRNGRFENWKVSARLWKKPDLDIKVDFNVDILKGHLSFPRQRCSKKDKSCTFEMIVPGEVVMQLESNDVLDIDNQVYSVDKDTFEHWFKLGLVTREEADRGIAQGQFIGRIEDVESISFSAKQIASSEPSALVYLGSEFTDEVLDVNSNGRPDTLLIRAPILIKRSGHYIFNGTILADRKREVGFYSEKQYLTPKDKFVELKVPLIDFKSRNAPYVFGNCLFYLDKGRKTPQEFTAKNTCSWGRGGSYELKYRGGEVF
jgi:hypothetical protein